MPANSTKTDVERELRRVLYETGVAKTNADDLVSITPRDALSEYLDSNPENNLASTMRSHKSRLTHFVKWCEEKAEIDDLNDITNHELEAFKQHQVTRGYAPRTLETHLETLGVFLRFCRGRNYVMSEVPYMVPDVDVPAEAETRDRLVERERADELVEYLARFHYASREHIAWLLLAETGMRICSLVALDLQDFHPPSQDDDGYLDLRHRPATSTRLKNGSKSERQVALAPPTCEALTDYIAHQREDGPDEFGREPLLSTPNGRIAPATVRSYVNKWTAPCAVGGGCPHGRDPAECSAAQLASDMDCPSKRSPHDVRRGYITYLRQQGVPKEIISQEVDASVAVLDHHYDKTTKAEQRRMRAAALKAVLEIPVDEADSL